VQKKSRNFQQKLKFYKKKQLSAWSKLVEIGIPSI